PGDRRVGSHDAAVRQTRRRRDLQGRRRCAEGRRQAVGARSQAACGRSPLRPSRALPAATMLIALNKPYGVLCTFTDRSGRAHGRPRRTLAELVDVANVYAAGRLDYDSEGLLLLSDDGALIKRLTDPRTATWKRYLAQVEGDAGDAALSKLRQGV